jgi:DNA (cytosine-5)-methyltransferase 1
VSAPLLIADLFCGAGGSTSGAMRAVRAMGRRAEVVAVNHWDLAIATHTQNHPEARHHCVNLDAARPEDIVPEGRLDLLMASPECTHHSRARGGKPVIDQMRMSAWHVQRWASTLDVRCILVENVAEFREWGPVTVSGRPDPAGRIVDARMDILGRHTGDVNVGDFNDPDLYHLAVRVTREGKAQ